MRRIEERLSGGVCNTKDPTLLSAGQLQSCSGLFYCKDRQHLCAAPGPPIGWGFNSGAPSSPVGARILEFPDLPNLLAWHEGTQYSYSSPFSESGAGTVSAGGLATGLIGGSSFDSVHFDAKHFLLNGADRNRVVQSKNAALTVRQHGLDPVVDPPVVASAGGAGWPLNTVGMGDGTYFLFTVEVLNPGTVDEVEGAFAGVPASANISGSANGLQITRPPKVNSNATHWRTYIYGPTPSGTTFTTDLYASFWRVSEKEFIASPDSVTLGTQAAGSGPNLPTTTAADVSGNPEWTNPAKFKLNDGDGATAGTGSPQQIDVLGSFGFPGSATVVRGVEVQIKNKALGFLINTMIQVDVSFDNAMSWGNARQFLVGEGLLTYSGSGLAYRLMILGGSSDTWGRTSLTMNDMVDAKFKVRVRLLTSGRSTDAAAVDCVQVKVYTNTASTISTDGPKYPVVAVTQNGLTVVQGSNFPPPIASTGDVMDGSLVLDDPVLKNGILWSVPGQPDYFPQPYRMRFQLRSYEQTKCIRRIGNRTAVGTLGALVRVNYLPLGVDGEFEQGRAYDVVTEDHGIVGPQAAAVIQIPGEAGGGRLVFLSRTGLMMSDLEAVEPVCDDFDIMKLIELQYIHKTVISVFSESYNVAVTYVPAGSTTLDATAWFNYHPSNIVNGRLKAGGILSHVGYTGATAGRFNNSGTYQAARRVMVLLNATDIKYLPPTGYTDLAETIQQLATIAGGTMKFRTRRISLGETPGGGGRVKRVWVKIARVAIGFVPLRMKLQLYGYRVGRTAGDDPIVYPSKTMDIMKEGLYHFEVDVAPDSLEVELSYEGEIVGGNPVITIGFGMDFSLIMLDVDSKSTTIPAS